jgi:hypothetical protein
VSEPLLFTDDDVMTVSEAAARLRITEAALLRHALRRQLTLSAWLPATNAQSWSSSAMEPVECSVAADNSPESPKNLRSWEDYEEDFFANAADPPEAESRTIAGAWDIVMVPPGRTHVYNLFCQWRELGGFEGIDYTTGAVVNRDDVYCRLEPSPGSPFPEGSTLVVRPSALEKLSTWLLMASPSGPEAALGKPADTAATDVEDQRVTRTSNLMMAALLHKLEVNIKPQSDAVGKIQGFVQQMGFKLSEGTILTKLKSIRETLEEEDEKK